MRRRKLGFVLRVRTDCHHTREAHDADGDAKGNARVRSLTLVGCFGRVGRLRRRRDSGCEGAVRSSAQRDRDCRGRVLQLPFWPDAGVSIYLPFTISASAITRCSAWRAHCGSAQHSTTPRHTHTHTHLALRVHCARPRDCERSACPGADSDHVVLDAAARLTRLLPDNPVPTRRMQSAPCANRLRKAMFTNPAARAAPSPFPDQSAAAFYPAPMKPQCDTRLSPQFKLGLALAFCRGASSAA